MSIIAGAFAIVLIAAAVQAVTGFGFALVAVPLLALATDPRSAVVGGSLASLVLTTVTAAREYRHVRWRAVALLSVALLVGAPAGLLVLRTLSERALTVLIAVVVLASTALVWRRPSLGGGPLTVLGVGAVAGVLTTATGTNGPPLVAAFQAMRYEPREFRATLAAVFTAAGALGVTGFTLAGQLNGTAELIGLAAVPAVALGWWAGDRLFALVEAHRFRTVVMVALVLSCVLALVKALLP